MGRWKFGGDAKAFAATSGSEGLEYLRIYTDESLNNYHQLVAKKSGLSFETYADGTRTSNWDAATKSDLENKLTCLYAGQSATEKTSIITGSQYQTYFIFGQKGLCCAVNPMLGNTEPQMGGNIPEAFEIHGVGTEAKSISIKIPAYTSVYVCSYKGFTIT